MTDRLLDRKELAAKLGQTVEWTYRFLKGLPGFPPAVLSSRWSERAVDLWIESRSRQTVDNPTTNTTPAENDADAWARRLDDRAERLAG